MGCPVDLDEKEVLVNRHVLLSEEIFKLAMKEAQKTCGGNLSLWIRKIMRKHFGIKEKK